MKEGKGKNNNNNNTNSNQRMQTLHSSHQTLHFSLKTLYSAHKTLFFSRYKVALFLTKHSDVARMDRRPIYHFHSLSPANES